MKLLMYELHEWNREEIAWLALRQQGDGVVVHVVDEKGEHIEAGNLIKFRNDGGMERLGGVNDALGFQLDERGRIKEEEVE